MTDLLPYFTLPRLAPRTYLFRGRGVPCSFPRIIRTVEHFLISSSHTVWAKLPKRAVFITEQVEEASSFLERLRLASPVRMVALCNPIHPGKIELLRAAAERDRPLFLALRGPLPSRSELADWCRGLSLCFFSEGISGEAPPELSFARTFRVDEIVSGEKDFERLRELETVARTELGVLIRRAGIFRDIDRLPWSRSSDKLSAEERYSARFVPQTLDKAVQMVGNGELRAKRIVEQATENLEKSYGLEVLKVAILTDPAVDAVVPRLEEEQPAVVPGARLCITCRAGEHVIVDNRRLLASEL